MRAFLLSATVIGFASSFVVQNPATTLTQSHERLQALQMTFLAPPRKRIPPGEKWFKTVLDSQGEGGRIDKLTYDATETLGKAQKFPSIRDEPFRQMNLNKLFATPFTPTTGTSDTEIDSELISEYLFEETKGAQLVFVDGKFRKDLSDLSAVSNVDGLMIGGLEDVPESRLAAVVDDLAFIPESDEDYKVSTGCVPFAQLNNALFRDTAVIYVDAGVNVTAPIQVLYFKTAPTTTSAAPLTSPRLVLRAEAGAAVSVHTNHACLGSRKSSTSSDTDTDTTSDAPAILAPADIRGLVNAFFRIVVAENADVSHCHVQEMAEDVHCLDTISVDIGAAANYACSAFGVGANINRVNIVAELNGDEGNVDLNGLLLAHRDQYADIHTVVKHNAESCTSNQQQRNLIADTASAVFKGRMRIEQVAQKTLSDQLCRTMMLGNDCHGYAMPTLEVIADDVACTHGCTFADLDEEAVFYLTSRGLDKLMSRQIMIASFADEVLRHFTDKRGRDRVMGKIRAMTPTGERAIGATYTSI